MRLLIIIAFLISFASFSQGRDNSIRVVKSRDTLAAYSGSIIDVSISYSTPQGDNFAGRGLSGGLGWSIRNHYYIYNGFYLGGSAQAHYLKVNDVQIAGNFNKLRKNDFFFFAGHEFQWPQHFRLGLDAGFGWTVQRGVQTIDQGGAKIYDTGTLYALHATLSYQRSKTVTFFFRSGYQFIDYQIEAPDGLPADFNSAGFIDLSLGIRFNLFRR